MKNNVELHGCLPCLVFIVFPLIVAFTLGYLTANLIH